MKQILFCVLITLLSACAPRATAATSMPVSSETAAPISPVQTETATIPTATEAGPSPKLPAASFEAQTYINEANGFALEYPAGWTVNEALIGDRASQVQFLSSPELADVSPLPEGATRISAVIYQWDPKNDLAAYVEHWKAAWEASGFTVVEEEQLTLELGLPAVQFTIQAPEAQSVILITALGDQYLVISGEGDLELVREIVQRVRPISR